MLGIFCIENSQFLDKLFRDAAVGVRKLHGNNVNTGEAQVW